jgi:hypothetical protein
MSNLNQVLEQFRNQDFVSNDDQRQEALQS